MSRHFAAPLILLGLFVSGLLWIRNSPLWPQHNDVTVRPVPAPAGEIHVTMLWAHAAPAATPWPLIAAPTLLAVALATFVVTGRRP